MPVKIDLSKSLAELTGNDWPDPPSDTRELVRERYALYRKPLLDLADHEIAKLISIAVGIEILIPLALARLRATPHHLRLICAVLAEGTYPWASNPNRVSEVRDIVYRGAVEIGAITKDVDRLSELATLWNAYAGFERRLSSIP